MSGAVILEVDFLLFLFLDWLLFASSFCGTRTCLLDQQSFGTKKKKKKKHDMDNINNADDDKEYEVEGDIRKVMRKTLINKGSNNRSSNCDKMRLISV